MISLPITGPYTAKDQRKADQCNKFIGRGSARSSTAKYATAFGKLANSGTYSANDTVFISAEGARAGRVPPDFNEIKLAAQAGVTFITDDVFNRNRPYNCGEREVADYLTQCGYCECAPGRWVRST